MRMCRFNDDRLGIVLDDQVHDVTRLQDEIRAASPFTMKGDPVIAALPRMRERLLAEAAGVQGLPLKSVALLSPVARPTKLVAAPSNYMAHIQEMGTGKVATSKHKGNIEQDGLFLKANSALVGASEGVPRRFPERRTDHELEFVIVIGQQGSDISQADALDHVAGYCLGLDIVVRGPEDRSFRKSCDGYAVLGPWLVTRDEIADPDDVDLRLDINGEPRQRTNTGQMIFNTRRLIEFASSFYTLYPGDCIYTGTPDGVAQIIPGDVISVSSPAIGAMDVPVRAHQISRS
jgi:2,4-diketo-3-deoxy-L-fuconate hydrolase